MNSEENSVERKKESIERELKRLSEAFQGPQELKQAMTYSLLAGGKRLRPLLVLASGEASGLPEESVLPMACALEMIHTYSLIHDDLPAMDNDDLRRGLPTNHKKFGEAMAILAGDALLNEALLLLMIRYAGTETGRDAIALIAQSAGQDGMIGGQVLDIGSENREIDLQTLQKMHLGKTGALIRASLSAPWILAGRSAEDVEAMDQLGADLGILFQIQDDILDVESDAETLGKSTGKDSRDHKSTYVSILGLPQSKELVTEIYGSVCRKVDNLSGDSGSLRHLIQMIYHRDR